MDNRTFEQVPFIIVLLSTFLFVCLSCDSNYPVVKIDLDDEEEIESGLVEQLEMASEYDEYIDLTDDEIYALADYLMPYIVEQIEQRGNDAIELFYMGE